MFLKITLKFLINLKKTTIFTSSIVIYWGGISEMNCKNTCIIYIYCEWWNQIKDNFTWYEYSNYLLFAWLVYL